VSICAYTDRFAHALFAAMGRPELSSDLRFAARDARVQHYAELDALIDQWTRARPAAEIAAKLRAANIPAAEVRSPKAAVRDPGVVARGETVPMVHPLYGMVDDIYAMGMPIQFSAAAAGFDQPPPSLGEHNRAVYGGILGYSQERIEALKAQGVI
jgi:crotonobetainyl-CoA:carnitine CoA-transferase CaiB-like acyl-CoA transferase